MKIKVTAQSDGLLLGYEKIGEDGNWYYQPTNSKTWFAGTMLNSEPVRREVDNCNPKDILE